MAKNKTLCWKPGCEKKHTLHAKIGRRDKNGHERWEVRGCPEHFITVWNHYIETVGAWIEAAKPCESPTEEEKP